MQRIPSCIPCHQITHSCQTDTKSKASSWAAWLMEGSAVFVLFQWNEKSVFQQKQKLFLFFFWRSGFSQIMDLPREWGGNEKMEIQWARQPLLVCLLPQTSSVCFTGWCSWLAEHLLPQYLSPREKGFQRIADSLAYKCHNDVVTGSSFENICIILPLDEDKHISVWVWLLLHYSHYTVASYKAFLSL